MLDVRRLRLLRELSRRGTIAAVAEALAFSPSAVSQQLGVLEREAGVALLERTGRGVTLTPAGLGLVVHAEAVLEQLERAAAELAETRSGPAGPVRIGAFPSAGRSMVPRALGFLADRSPALEPMVLEIDPAAVGDALRAGDLDVALVHGYDFVPERSEPGVESLPLFSEAMCLAHPAGSAGGTGGGGVPVPRRWWVSPWITATPGTLCHAMTVRACRASGFEPGIRHRVDDFDTVLGLVAAGQGVALLPAPACADAPSGVASERLPIRRRTRLAHRSGAGGHPAVRAVVEALRAAIPPEATVGG